jgi:rubrerythrin
VAVVRTFTWALEAEKTHVRLFEDALALVELKPDSWVWAARAFYVCPVCGYTAEEQHAALCGVCNCAWTRFGSIR